MASNTFPRESGKCVVHTIPIDIVDITNDITDDIDHTSDEIYQPYHNIAMEYLKGKEYLKNTGRILIHGDLIYYQSAGDYRSDGYFIYYQYNKDNNDNNDNNGKIIAIGHDEQYDEYGYIPKMYSVIVNNVPIDYWTDGIPRNSIVWFEDYLLVKEQCLNNINNDIIAGMKECVNYTTFIYKEKLYHIILDTYVENSNIFRQILLSLSNGPFNAINDNVGLAKSYNILYLSYKC